jgi:hypothetical protein
MESRSPNQQPNQSTVIWLAKWLPQCRKKEKRVSDLSCPTDHNFESSKMDHTRTTKQSVCNRISSITTCKLQSCPPQVLESKTNKATMKGLTPDSFNGPVMGPHNSSNSRQRLCVHGIMRMKYSVISKLPVCLVLNSALAIATTHQFQGCFQEALRLVKHKVSVSMGAAEA